MLKLDANHREFLKTTAGGRRSLSHAKFRTCFCLPQNDRRPSPDKVLDVRQERAFEAKRQPMILGKVSHIPPTDRAEPAARTYSLHIGRYLR
jgi:hypothetical protein